MSDVKHLRFSVEYSSSWAIVAMALHAVHKNKYQLLFLPSMSQVAIKDGVLRMSGDRLETDH